MPWKRNSALAFASWIAYFATALALNAADPALLPWFSIASLGLLIVTGFLLPWRASLAFLAVVVAFAYLAGPGSLPVHLTLGGAPLSTGTSVLLVGSVLVGLGVAAQLAISGARRAGVEEGGRVAAEEAGEHLRLVLRSTSHEIGNVLTSLNLMVETSLDRDSGAELSRQVLRMSNRIRRLVGDLSDAALAMEGGLRVRRRPCDLARLVNALADEYRDKAARSGLRLAVEAPASLVALADIERVEQAVANLLQNAVRYTPEGGTVRVRVFAMRDGEPVIEVSDSGLGLTDEQIRGLFHPFTRYHADHDASGSGLGLWVVHNIMSAHGGAVEARSAGPQQGTTFTLRFPASSAA